MTVPKSTFSVRVKTHFLVPPNGSHLAFLLSIFLVLSEMPIQRVLCFVVVSKKSKGEPPTPQVLWEPLTFSKLLEEKPTRCVPGDSVFRYGRAQQWVIKNAAVI